MMENNFEYETGFVNGFKAGVESAQPKWISVDDPPKDTSPVLIRYLYSSGLHLCTIGSYLKKLGVWDTDMGFDLKQITHWMPLPEPPKEG